MPFAFEGGDTGCLLIHGFTATPQEMRFLGQRLHAAGHGVLGMRVAGHGTTVRDCERTSHEDWYASVRAALREIRSRSRRVVVVGQSMGALLALRLAADEPHAVNGLALLAPALVLSQPWLAWIAPALPLLAYLVPGIDKGPGDVADAAVRAARATYPVVPLRALGQLVRLQGVVRDLLPQVRQPALLVHSKQDHTCPLVNLDLLSGRLGGPIERLLLEDSYHVVSIDVEREKVATAVADFVRRRAAGGPGASRRPAK